MGCCGDMIAQCKYDAEAFSFQKGFDVSDERIIELFGFKTTMNKIEILKKIKEENDIVVPLLKKKIDELMKKRDEKIIMIGKGKFCGSPCYAYNKNILLHCPKCNGSTSIEIENAYEKRQRYNEYTGRNEEYETMVEKDICVRFDFNDKVEKIDYDFDAFCKKFEKIDKEKTVHWKAEIIVPEGGDNEYKLEEKDMPYHYMVLEGERFDFPYGLHMKEFFKMNNHIFFPFDKNRIFFFRTIDEIRRAGLQSIGEAFSIYYDNTKEDIGQSLGEYGYANIHKVFYFQCNECKHKYHIIKTLPFMYRDKSKDAK